MHVEIRKWYDSNALKYRASYSQRQAANHTRCQHNYYYPAQVLINHQRLLNINTAWINNFGIEIKPEEVAICYDYMSCSGVATNVGCDYEICNVIAAHLATCH